VTKIFFLQGLFSKHGIIAETKNIFKPNTKINGFYLTRKEISLDLMVINGVFPNLIDFFVSIYRLKPRNFISNRCDLCIFKTLRILIWEDF
jgi:hypothetical protein